MSELPEPPVSAECDCRNLDSFMLNVERLMASELVALSSHEVVAAALFLWCRAWKQMPAASLPDDDRVLAAYARLPTKRFKKLKIEVMRGFVKCSDGRFYHAVLAAEAMRAYGHKEAARTRRETEAERLRKWRQTQRETSNETHFVGSVTGRDGTGPSSVPVRTGTAAEPPPHADIPEFLDRRHKPPDLTTRIFTEALDWVQQQSGRSREDCRSLLGKWRKALGDAALIETLGAAQREGPIDAVAWIERSIAVQKPPKPKGPIFN